MTCARPQFAIGPLDWIHSLIYITHKIYLKKWNLKSKRLSLNIAFYKQLKLYRFRLKRTRLECGIFNRIRYNLDYFAFLSANIWLDIKMLIVLRHLKAN